MNPEKLITARAQGNRDRQARLVLAIRGVGKQAQMLLEAEALAETQRKDRYAAEVSA